jgi:acyl carrier protein
MGMQGTGQIPEKQVQVEQIFRRVLRLEAGQDLGAIRRSAFPRWDSICHAELIIAIQNAFSIRFSVQEIMTLDSFAEICRVVSLRVK